MEKLERKERSNRKLFILIFLAVILVSLDLRLIFLKADPFPYSVFGATWVDEGVYAHNARNQILFGEWKLENDSWNPMYISPTYNYLEFLSFEIWGVNTFAMRLVPAFVGIISLLTAGLFFLSKKFEEGITFLILLAVNPMHITYSRTATVESILLALIVVIIGLMVCDKKYSWFLVGLLTPVLFFTKIISAFFIAAIPLTLLSYWFFYKSKIYLKKFGIFISGAVLSLTLWLFWLIPNFSDWKYMNFDIFAANGRFGLSIKEFGVIIVTASQFFLLNPLLVMAALFIIIYLFIQFRRKEKIDFFDLFLVVTLILFFLQILLTDYDLRRFLLLVPILALASSRLILRTKEINVNISENKSKFDNKFLVIFFILTYIIISLSQLFPFYVNIVKDLNNSFIIRDNSLEIGKYIPPYSKVYGNQAAPLSMENKIKPYHGNYLDRLHNTEENILFLLQSGEINYAVLKENIFNEADLKEYDRDLNKSKVYRYLHDNFEVIKEIQGKHSRTNEPDRKYIYRRIISSDKLFNLDKPNAFKP